MFGYHISSLQQQSRSDLTVSSSLSSSSSATPSSATISSPPSVVSTDRYNHRPLGSFHHMAFIYLRSACVDSGLLVDDSHSVLACASNVLCATLERYLEYEDFRLDLAGAMWERPRIRGRGGVGHGVVESGIIDLFTDPLPADTSLLTARPYSEPAVLDVVPCPTCNHGGREVVGMSFLTGQPSAIPPPRPCVPPVLFRQHARAFALWLLALPGSNISGTQLRFPPFFGVSASHFPSLPSSSLSACASASTNTLPLRRVHFFNMELLQEWSEKRGLDARVILETRGNHGGSSDVCKLASIEAHSIILEARLPGLERRRTEEGAKAEWVLRVSSATQRSTSESDSGFGSLESALWSNSLSRLVRWAYGDPWVAWDVPFPPLPLPPPASASGSARGASGGDLETTMGGLDHLIQRGLSQRICALAPSARAANSSSTTAASLSCPSCCTIACEGCILSVLPFSVVSQLSFLRLALASKGDTARLVASISAWIQRWSRGVAADVIWHIDNGTYGNANTTTTAAGGGIFLPFPKLPLAVDALCGLLAAWRRDIVQGFPKVKALRRIEGYLKLDCLRVVSACANVVDGALRKVAIVERKKKEGLQGQAQGQGCGQGGSNSLPFPSSSNSSATADAPPAAAGAAAGMAARDSNASSLTPFPGWFHPCGDAAGAEDRGSGRSNDDRTASIEELFSLRLPSELMGGPKMMMPANAVVCSAPSPSSGGKVIGCFVVLRVPDAGLSARAKPNAAATTTPGDRITAFFAPIMLWALGPQKTRRRTGV
jgi:hypothetical protein